jgi:hypothetical protein
MPALEVVAVSRASAHPALAGFSLDAPRPGQIVDGDALEIDGWVVGAAGPATAVLIGSRNGLRCRLPVERPRPDVAADRPTQPWALTAGFRGSTPLTGAAEEHLVVAAETAAGDFVALADVRIRPLPETADLDGSDDWTGPDFVVLGAQRAGSTSLYAYLTTHPQVVPAARKEVRYFSSLHDRSWAWYRRQFPAALAAGAITGEATPYYLFHPHAPRRVAERLPRARLIVVLRNPVARAVSQWAHETARGTEWLPLAEAIAAEPGRLAGELERMLADEQYASTAHQHHSYVARGRYADQLAAWFAHFPRERLLVLRSEDLYADPAAVVRQVTDFLELEPAPLGDARPHNERAYPPPEPALRKHLEATFAPANRALEDLLGRPFGWDGGKARQS